VLIKIRSEVPLNIFQGKILNSVFTPFAEFKIAINTTKALGIAICLYQGLLSIF
jgi:hypothetical protein